MSYVKPSYSPAYKPSKDSPYYSTSPFDNKQDYDEFKRILRKSFKRSLDFYSGNFGLKATGIESITERKKKIKSLFEFGQSDADSKSDAQSAECNVLATRVAPASEKKKFNSAGPLSHLVIKNALEIPKPAWHPQWKLMRVISGHTGWVRCLSVDTSNEWFVSGGADRLIKIWDLASGTLKLSLTGHIHTVRDLIVSPRHPYLFSCGEDHAIKCWDLEYNKVIRDYHGHLSGVYCLTLHPTLDVLASGGRDAVVRVWDVRTKQSVYVLSGHSGTIMSLDSQNSCPQLVSGSMDKMVRLWDLTTGKSYATLTNHKKSIRAMAFHPREYTFCSAAADNIKVWKCPEGRFNRNLDPISSIVNCTAIKQDGSESSVVVAGTDNGFLHFWDWKSGRRFQSLESEVQPGSMANEKAIFACVFDKSETRLITADCDKTIKVFKEVDEMQDVLPE